MSHQQIMDFLDEARPFYLASCDGDQAHVRPLGAHMLIDGTIHFAVGTFKDVWKQITTNPKVEIVALQGKDWLRYTGEAVVDSDEIAQKFVKPGEPLTLLYEQNGWTLGAFHLENATCHIIHMMGEGDPIDC